jgi:hypothetical protein
MVCTQPACSVVVNRSMASGGDDFQRMNAFGPIRARRINQRKKKILVSGDGRRSFKNPNVVRMCLARVRVCLAFQGTHDAIL